MRSGKARRHFGDRGKTNNELLPSFMPVPNDLGRIFQPFALLEKQCPNVLQKVIAIGGNLETSDMNLSVDDREHLCKEIAVVIHSAASVNFVDPIQKACRVNIQGVSNVLEQLAMKMDNLEVRKPGFT